MRLKTIINQREENKVCYVCNKAWTHKEDGWLDSDSGEIVWIPSTDWRCTCGGLK